MTEAPIRPGLLDRLGVGVLCLCALLAGLLELLFVPLYVGGSVLPLAVLGACVGNVVLPRMARSLVDSTAASLAPFLVWLAVVLVLGLAPREEGDVVLPGNGAGEWVAYGVLLGGAVAGTVTIVLGTGPSLTARPDVSR